MQNLYIEQQARKINPKYRSQSQSIAYLVHIKKSKVTKTKTKQKTHENQRPVLNVYKPYRNVSQQINF